MTEKELNIEYICNKTLLDKEDELVPIILDMIKDSYKAGLSQSEYDNTMNLIEENRELKEDISFCLKSIKQEMDMSTDSRTRSEMTSCYEILKRWNK